MRKVIVIIVALVLMGGLVMVGQVWSQEEDKWLGDVTGDRVVNIVDALYIAQYLAGIRPATDLDMEMADVNLDGAVTIVDALWIQQRLAKLRDGQYRWVGGE